MAPLALADLDPEPVQPISDPSVLPPHSADERLKKLWNLHGHPHSKTFANPDLTSLAALIRHNATRQPSQAAFICPDGEGFNIINWHEFDRLVTAAAAHYAQAFKKEIDVANQTAQQPTIALLGNGNTIDYFVTEMALLKLHVRILLLSNKNAPTARDHLITVCNAVGLIADQSNGPVLLAEGFSQPFVDLIPLQELRGTREAPEAKATAFRTNDEWNLQAMIIHSSGSTGLPKPIIHTNRSLCLIARMYRLFPDFIIENWYICFPLFHIAGVSTAISGIPSGLAVTLPPVNWPPAPSAILTAWEKLEKLGHPADCLHCAPSVIEDLYAYISATTGDFAPLTSLKILQPGGAPLSPALLAKLNALGANVKTTYGSTEIGPPFRTIPHTRGNPNCYHVRSLYPDSPLVRMEPLGDGLFECVVHKGFELAAELWLADGAPDPYRTNDLFVEDPPGSGFFVLQGRKDDILVHDNGEKTHAGALQMQLEESDEAVAKTAVFGSARPCPAVVVEPAPSAHALEAEALEARVWDAVSRCNEAAAAHSRIDRALILILKEGESLPVTPKGNVRRKAAWEQYGSRVEELYERHLGSGGAETGDATATADDGLPDLEFIRACVAEVCQKAAADVAPAGSFYDIGLDSQRAVKLRSKLARRFGAFPLMFVFEYPTLEKMHAYLTRPKSGAAVLSKDEERRNYIRATIKKYNGVIDEWKASRALPAPSLEADGEVVYLTGASGALGNALLEVFVRDPAVKKVYCAIRGQDPQAKVLSSLKGRGYAEEVFASSKICAVPYDMKDDKLGLTPELYDQLLSEVTIVIHNAWKMDFNQRVEMFEADCLRGTMNLLSFCYAGAKKTFSFMSSVAACMGEAARGQTIQETPVNDNPLMTLNTGYAQSKFIVENITQHYAAALSMPVKLFRVGQLCGHSQLGVWNSTEMWPIMIATGLRHLHALPLLPASAAVNWLPVDACARGIQAATTTTTTGADNNNSNTSPQTPYAVHNLVNPHSVTWTAFLDTLAAAAATRGHEPFAAVPMGEWVARLERAAEREEEEGSDDVPGLKLLGFFQEMAAEGGGGGEGANGEGVGFATASVRDARPVDAEMVGLWLDRWREQGFL